MSFRGSIFSGPRKLKSQWLRHQAQRKLENAVRRGKVKKPTRCQRCKQKFPKHKLQGHHRNYRKPLEGIKWYCQACHYKIHGPRFERKALYRQMQREAGIIGH